MCRLEKGRAGACCARRGCGRRATEREDHGQKRGPPPRDARATVAQRDASRALLLLALARPCTLTGRPPRTGTLCLHDVQGAREPEVTQLMAETAPGSRASSTDSANDATNAASLQSTRSARCAQRVRPRAPALPRLSGLTATQPDKGAAGGRTGRRDGHSPTTSDSHAQTCSWTPLAAIHTARALCPGGPHAAAGPAAQAGEHGERRRTRPEGLASHCPPRRAEARRGSDAWSAAARGGGRRNARSDAAWLARRRPRTVPCPR